ncbi:PilZ domain-containing protein [Kineosporia babensis]|uniref:PilZ domain-containing protein n=1 Tax=Kineosporia babensis TaxID=499548 RepID=A0A9X1STV7_9ACTN|nr:PilZ domain-containing protein [Kineosporia babensis]MCD5312309.1 PilZ domain-containing protein [Kineosporia babensis]
MRSIARGSRLVAGSGEVTVTMRSLRTVELSGTGWAIPVIADLAALQASGLSGRTVAVDVSTEAGPVQLEVEIVATSGDFMLRAPQVRPSQAIHPAALSGQRRENVRGPVRLEFRGAVLDARAATPRGRRRHGPGYLAAMGPGEGAQADLVGATTSVSAGGVCVDLEYTVPLAENMPLYGEMTLPNGDLVPALMVVREQTPKGFRAEFTDISPIDSERLVRLVFQRERSELAGRR